MVLTGTPIIMEDDNYRQGGEQQPDGSVWPPAPSNGLSQENPMNKALITNYKWLDLILGGSIALILPSIMAGLAFCADVNLRPPPYSLLTLLIGYFVAFFVCGGVALMFRRQHRLFGTAMLVGTLCSPLLFGVIIAILQDFPAPP